MYEYIFGAVCPKEKKAVGLILPYTNHQTLQLLLNEVAKEIPPGRIAVMIMDGAGWHHAGDLIIPDNIVFLFLPPYSPELNPVEQIWQYIKDKFLANRVFESSEDILDACCEAWNSFANNPSLISSLTSRSWANI